MIFFSYPRAYYLFDHENDELRDSNFAAGVVVEGFDDLPDLLLVLGDPQQLEQPAQLWNMLAIGVQEIKMK